MEKYHIIYIYILGKREYSYSIVIENHYNLVIDLWCRYVGRKKPSEIFEAALLDAVEEYVKMGLSNTSCKLYIQNKEDFKKVLDRYMESISERIDLIEVKYFDKWRYRRSRELALYCLKKKVGKYPPSVYS